MCPIQWKFICFFIEKKKKESEKPILITVEWNGERERRDFENAFYLVWIRLLVFQI